MLAAPAARLTADVQGWGEGLHTGPSISASWMALSSEHLSQEGPYCSEGLEEGAMGWALLTWTPTSSQMSQMCPHRPHWGLSGGVEGDMDQLSSTLSAFKPERVGHRRNGCWHRLSFLACLNLTALPDSWD